MTADGFSTDHDRFDELAVGWALHALEPEDETFFLAHLAGCERCAVTVAETRDVMSAMATDLPQAEPSEGLRERIRAAVEQTEQLPAPDRPAVEPPARRGEEAAPVPAPRKVGAPLSSWRRALPLGLVAAGVAAIIGLGVWNVVLNADRQELQATVAEQNAVMNGLLTPGRATIAPLKEGDKAVATVVVRGDEVDLITHGLAVNDATKTTYVLWGMGENTAQSLGAFDVTSSQLDMKTVGSRVTGADSYATYGISIEPGRQAPSLPTEVVATGQVTN